LQKPFTKQTLLDKVRAVLASPLPIFKPPSRPQD
jgi:hypothetical protein